MLADEQTYIVNIITKKTKKKKNYQGKTFNHISAFSSPFVANAARFVFKSEFLTRSKILDLLTNSFGFIFALSISLVNLL